MCFTRSDDAPAQAEERSRVEQLSPELQAKFKATSAVASLKTFLEQYCTRTGSSDESRTVDPHVLALGIQDYDNKLVGGSILNAECVHAVSHGTTLLQLPYVKKLDKIWGGKRGRTLVFAKQSCVYIRTAGCFHLRNVLDAKGKIIAVRR